MPYKIRRKSDGLFSSGGSWPYFSKSGKTWENLGPLKSHLSMVVNSRYVATQCPGTPADAVPEDWEVVRGDFVVVATAPAQLLPGDKCVNCKRPKKEHKRGKCLFEPTKYKGVEIKE